MYVYNMFQKAQSQPASLTDCNRSSTSPPTVCRCSTCPVSRHPAQSTTTIFSPDFCRVLFFLVACINIQHLIFSWSCYLLIRADASTRVIEYYSSISNYSSRFLLLNYQNFPFPAVISTSDRRLPLFFGWAVWSSIRTELCQLQSPGGADVPTVYSR